MDTQLRALIVEDSEDDTLLLVRELRKAGFDVSHSRVETRKAMTCALDRGQWDLVITDYTLPRFSGTEALGISREHDPDLPVIVVSGTIGEDVAVEMMRAGAVDYILKDNLARLSLSIERELADAIQRREYKQAEEALAESQRRLNALMGNLPDMAYRCDNSPNRPMSFVSLGCRLLTGYSPEALTAADGIPWTHLIHVDDRELVRKAIQNAHATEPFEVEYRIWTSENQEKWVWEKGICVHDEEGTDALLEGFIGDVTDRKRAEREREELISRLEAQNAELERYAYTVSHDLKTPVITVTGFVGVLRQDLAEGRYEAMENSLDRIDKAAARMDGLLKDLLQLSRVGRLLNTPESVRLEDLAHEAWESLRPTRDPRVRFEVMSGLPTVSCDRVRMLEVFQNLIDNALKYMGSEPEPRILFGVRNEGEETVCYFRDNGIGIEPRFHHKVFALFEQLDPNVDGSGIGLALVKRIIESHGGRIWLESEGAGQGTTFCFTVPSTGHKGSTNGITCMDSIGAEFVQK